MFLCHLDAKMLAFARNVRLKVVCSKEANKAEFVHPPSSLIFPDRFSKIIVNGVPKPQSDVSNRRQVILASIWRFPLSSLVGMALGERQLIVTASDLPRLPPRRRQHAILRSSDYSVSLSLISTVCCPAGAGPERSGLRAWRCTNNNSNAPSNFFAPHHDQLSLLHAYSQALQSA
jgi:hypothetical protein